MQDVRNSKLSEAVLSAIKWEPYPFWGHSEGPSNSACPLSDTSLEPPEVWNKWHYRTRALGSKGLCSIVNIQVLGDPQAVAQIGKNEGY